MARKSTADNLVAGQRVVEATAGAYSRERYTDYGWLCIARRLLAEGASEAEAEWIMKSQHMRRAADAANKGDQETTVADFARYVVTSQDGTLPWQTLLASAREARGPAYRIEIAQRLKLAETCRTQGRYDLAAQHDDKRRRAETALASL